MSRNTFLALFLIIAGFGGVFVFGSLAENRRPPIPRGYEEEDLVFRGAKLKGFSLGLNGLLADMYWMRSLQYLGGKLAEKPEVNINVDDLREFEPAQLYPLLDNSVSFDPQFIGVYEYGAVVLPAVDRNLAIQIVEKGIENNPEEWRLYNHLGYIYWRNGEFEKAAQAYENAAKIPDAPSLMKAMVARMKSDAGSRETARAIYRQMYESAQDSRSKQTAELYLFGLNAADQIDNVNSVLDEFRKNNGRCVSSLRDIFPSLSAVKLPNSGEFQIDNKGNLVDPSGVPYSFDAGICSIALDRQKTKLPVN